MDGFVVFVVVGAVGLGVIVIALVFGDVLDGMLPDIALGDSGGLLSTEVVGSFLAAFGFGGALLMGLGKAPLGAATAGALAAGVLMGGAAFAVTRSLLQMPTDPTPRTADLVGRLGTVITRIPASGLGEVAVVHAGQRVKLSARADAPLASGTNVVVVDVTSPTSVVVAEVGF
ncbi:MAG: hypothetical protein M3O86_01910 [Actinomycetota bacterium]|nr:hypothetical protein [Actinomycetota bacterium]